MIESMLSDPNTSNLNQVNKKSFDETVKRRETLNPTTIDVEPALEIPNDFFQEGCKPFQQSFIARLDPTGLKFFEVKKTLEEQWKLGCKFVPMTKGFFIIMLSSEADKEKIRANKWYVKEQALKLIDWYLGLPIELWTEKSLLSMGKSLGSPIVVDQRTLDLEYGYFSAVLVDIDFSKHTHERISLTTGGKKFWQYVDIQNPPMFCFSCNIIGHIDDECKKKAKNKVVSKETKSAGKETTQQTKQVWKVKSNNIENVVEVATTSMLEKNLANNQVVDDQEDLIVQGNVAKQNNAVKAAIAARKVDKSNTKSEVTGKVMEVKSNVNSDLVKSISNPNAVNKQQAVNKQKLEGSSMSDHAGITPVNTRVIIMKIILSA
ncbi:uncharacterized protein LOC113272820 [Papaver somniferum]|uniref:uncharacterized protein LOC113272820 n=1 Tax=Papaver somniferum TaxID=3469 RepID=UPI000E6FDEB9|nr:uncharacterized protein LOC113272820 [Papaver somniferum]